MKAWLWIALLAHIATPRDSQCGTELRRHVPASSTEALRSAASTATALIVGTLYSIRDTLITAPSGATLPTGVADLVVARVLKGDSAMLRTRVRIPQQNDMPARAQWQALALFFIGHNPDHPIPYYIMQDSHRPGHGWIVLNTETDSLVADVIAAIAGTGPAALAGESDLVFVGHVAHVTLCGSESPNRSICLSARVDSVLLGAAPDTVVRIRHSGPGSPPIGSHLFFLRQASPDTYDFVLWEPAALPVRNDRLPTRNMSLTQAVVEIQRSRPRSGDQ